MAESSVAERRRASQPGACAACGGFVSAARGGGGDSVEVSVTGPVSKGRAAGTAFLSLRGHGLR
jgi:hypothetical protein